MSNNIIMRAVVGKTSNEVQDRYIEALHGIVESVGGFDLSDLFPSFEWIWSMFSRSKFKVEICHCTINDVLESFVQDHREKRKVRVAESAKGEKEDVEDLLDVLIRLQEEGDADLRFHLINDAIKGLIMDMINGGSETTSSIMQYAMSELISNPRVMKKAQVEVRNALKGKAEVTESDIRELNYLQNVIKETMRLHPPLPLLVPRKKSEIMGYETPAKSRVIVNAWAIGRDPKYWENAEEFKPERFEERIIDYKGVNFELLPFGAGRRMCPGMMFGVADMELPLAQLLYYFDRELPTDTEIKLKSLDMSESFGVTAHRMFDLMLQANVNSDIPYLGQQQ